MSDSVKSIRSTGDTNASWASAAMLGCGDGAKSKSNASQPAAVLTLVGDGDGDGDGFPAGLLDGSGVWLCGFERDDPASASSAG